MAEGPIKTEQLKAAVPTEISTVNENSDQLLVAKVGRVFAVRVTSNDVDRDEGFKNLLDDLCTKFDRGAVHKELADKRKKSEQNLRKVKLRYFERVLIHETIHRVLLNEETKDVRSFQPRDMLFQDLRLKLNCAETCNYLEGCCPNGNDVSPVLLGLNKTFIMQASPNISQGDLEREVMPPLEEILTNQLKTVAGFLAKDGKSADLDAKGLAETVAELLRTLEDETRMRQQRRTNLNIAFEQCQEAFSVAFELMASLINEQRLCEQSAYYTSHVEQLTFKCEALTLKAKVTNLQVLCNTYTEEAISKLRKNRSDLETSSESVEKLLKKKRVELMEYRSIGDRFNRLVEEYGQLKAELDESQRVLQVCTETH